MSATILLTTQAVEIDITAGYVIGAMIALLIFGYLIYSLVKPEKF